MKKNIFFLLFLSIFIGFFLVLPSIFFATSSYFLKKGNLEYSQASLFPLQFIFPYNSGINLRIGDILYKEGFYSAAYALYANISCGNKNDFCYTLKHNLGNTYYRMGEEYEEKEIKKSYWNESLKSYAESLSIKEDILTRANYEFVLKKLQDLENPPPPEDQQNQPQSKDEKNKEENSSEDKNEEHQNQQEKNDDSEQNQNSQQEEQKQGNKQENQEPQTYKNPNTGIGGEKEELNSDLSDEEKQNIENYIEGLKEEEKQNQEFNKPGKKDSLWGGEAFELFEDNKKNTDW